jgi:hypothetical protein
MMACTMSHLLIELLATIQLVFPLLLTEHICPIFCLAVMRSRLTQHVVYIIK